jgi:hypothetical protein
MPRAPRGTPLPPNLQVSDSGARTNAILVDDVQRAAAMMELPPLLRADGTPLPPFRIAEPQAAGQDLASVIGGHTHSRHIADVAIESRGVSRWAIAVLLVAAIVGAIAAWGIARRGSDADPALDAVLNPPVIVKTAPTPPVVVEEAPVKVVKPEVKQEEIKAPDVTPEVKQEKIEDVKPEVKPEEPKPQPVAEPARPIKRTKPVATGTLRVNSQPWSMVTVAGQTQSTPGAKFTLPVGRHKVTFYNPDIDVRISKTCSVVADKPQTCTANLEDEN